MSPATPEATDPDSPSDVPATGAGGAGGGPRAAVVDRALGAVLCLAAAMKAAKALSAPEEGARPAFVLAGAAVELLIGVALGLRLRRRVTVPAAGLLFAMLAGVSLVGVQRGIASCGCFGRVAVPPWATLAFDAAAAVALLARRWSALPPGDGRATSLFVATLASLSAGLVVGSALYPRPGATTGAHARAEVVTLDPDRLLGQTFPYLDRIRIDADLSRGDWKVILARPGCKRCEQRLRDGECRPTGGERVAVVLVGTDPSWTLPTTCPARLGHAREGTAWAFESPMVLRLADGRVVEAR